jgi:hypothetical protein
LEIDQEISISEICDESELHDLESDDVEKIAQLFCPQFSRLVPLSDSEYSLEDLIDDVEAFLEAHQGIMTNSTPNFW